MKVDILGILSFLADLSPFLLLLIYNKLLVKGTFMVLFLWTCTSLTFDFFVAFSSVENYSIIAFYSVMVESVFVGALYSTIIKKKFSRFFVLFITIIFFFYSYYFWHNSEAKGFSNWLASLAVIYTLILSLLTFREIYFTNKNQFLLEDSSIWLTFAYLIYAAGNLFLFAITENLPNIFTSAGVWIIFIIANILKNLFFVKAIVEEKKQIKI